MVVNDAAGFYHLRARELTGGTWADDWQDLESALRKFNIVLSPQNGPAAIVTPDGGIDAFAVGIDGTIVSCRWDPGLQAWRGLRKLKKSLSVPSELISVGSWNGTALFMRSDNEPYYLPRATPTYSWRPVFGELHLGPVAVGTPGERMDLFGVGSDDRLVHKWCIQGLNWKPSLKEWTPSVRGTWPAARSLKSEACKDGGSPPHKSEREPCSGTVTSDGLRVTSGR